MPEHAPVEAPVLAHRLVLDVRHQTPAVAIDALLMALATIIVGTLHQSPSDAQRMAAECGRALRDAVGREARDALAAKSAPDTTQQH